MGLKTPKLVSEVASILARARVEETAKLFDDSDLYYATLLVKSTVDAYVRPKRNSKVETSRNAPKKGHA